MARFCAESAIKPQANKQTNKLCGYSCSITRVHVRAPLSVAELTVRTGQMDNRRTDGQEQCSMPHFRDGRDKMSPGDQ